jgi:EAL domain-containing protein (putative c-di-GMP-specific phosphodiesterase class I)/uncharacterized caspase-like protein
VAGRQYSILIGVNTVGRDNSVPPLTFAEADAEAMYRALTDEATGTFDPGDSQLLLGSRATTAEVKSALRTAALQAKDDDLVFVYFAGHALLPQSPPYNDPYLLTADVEVDKIDYHPDDALRMGFLMREVFEATSGSSMLVLDCCHAGGFAGLGRRDSSSDEAALLKTVEQMYAGRRPARQSALFACPPDRTAREVKKLGHGTLTHHVLEGLAGAAAAVDGAVTFDQLIRYVCDQDVRPTPGYFSQGWGSGIVVTRPGASISADAIAPPTFGRRIGRLSLNPCATPMDSMQSSLEQLLDKILDSESRPASKPGDAESTAVLERLRNAVGARGVAEVSVSNSQLELIGLCGDLARNEATSFVTQVMAKANRHGESAIGHVGTSANGMRRLLAVQAQLGSRSRFLVFADLPTPVLDLGEPLALALGIARDTVGRLTRAETEVALITALRERFGRVPERLYQRCLTAYRSALDAVHIAFEPVISLSDVPSTLGIYSWEALARRTPRDRSAPVDLLQTAASWTDEFLVLRDSILATKAIAQYAHAHRDGPWGHDSPKPVSINVSTRSLLKSSYISGLSEAIGEAGLGRYGVTLEISEHDAISPHPGEAQWWKPDAHSYFQTKLTDIAKRLHVNFAIDDFGVGHASLDRIASLDVTQIKVDRAILHHALALDELDLVVKLATDAYGSERLPNQRVVVVEGFDSESLVTLNDLYAHGVRYVQGYISEEPASQQLRPLSQDLRNRIAALIRRPPHVG